MKTLFNTIIHCGEQVSKFSRTRRYLLLIIIIGCVFFVWSNSVAPHMAQPPKPPPPPPEPINPGGPPRPAPQPTPQPPTPGTPAPATPPPTAPTTPDAPHGTAPSRRPAVGAAIPPPPLSPEGITYDFIGGLFPQKVKELLTSSTSSISVNMRDPALIGIEPLLNSYFTPFDPYQIESISGLNLPVLKKTEIFSPLLNLFLKQHLILVILQSMVQMETCPEAPASQYLVEIGQPSLVGAQIAPKVSPGILGSDWVKGSAVGKRVAEYVQSAVGTAAPQPPPEPPKGINSFETMVNRLIVEELGKDYYFPGDIGFAPCLKRLDEEIIPYIIKAAKINEHSLIRRNAVALLEIYNTPEAVKALREILLANYDKDKVIRNRALIALITKRDTEIVPFLIDSLKNSTDTYFKTLAAHALGILGDKRAVKPLMDYINTDPNNRDILWSAIPALGILGDNGKEVKDFIYKIADSTRLAARTFVLLSLYALGEEVAAEYLELNPAKKDPFLRIDYVAYYYAIKVLGKKGEKGIPFLLWLVNYEPLDPRMRIAAMCQIKFTNTKEHISILKNLIAGEKTPPILKAYALYLLFTFNDKNIIADATEVLGRSFTGIGKKGVKVYGEGFDTVVALRILGLLNANKVPLLKELISTISQDIKIKPQRNKDVGILLPQPPLMETALEELSKINSPATINLLLPLLADSEFSHRADVARVLGNIPSQKQVVRALIKTLSDKDGWTRYCAYSSLKRLTGQDLSCEWLGDPAETRMQTVAKWEKWWAEKGSKD
ncbi:MAG: HEAT repeat domain-containing protein [Planctomycetota bacterium]|nr:HEAT repeat domain-containing protein [Planctomycetota bacterium]MDI6787916.1 HEAT repeat domain-containing protein [Planctomycetota bacterium]